MKKISIFIILYFSLFFSDDVAEGMMCSMNMYYDRIKKDCELCPKCEAGKEYTENCGYNETGYPKTPGAQRCKSCTPGDSFKDKESTQRCQNCQECERGKVETAPCTVTRDTVCANECPKGTYNDRGVCRPVPSTVPVTSPVTTPITTVSTTQVSSQKDEIKLNGTQKPTTTVVFYSQGTKPEDDPQALQRESSEGRFLKPGWVVFFCLMGSLFVIAFVFVTCHKRTRKQISGFCRRKYGVLWSDQDVERDPTSDPLTAEDFYVEPAATEPTNGATPIPSWEEPVSPVVLSSSSSEQVHPRLVQTTEIDKEKMQCACIVASSDQPMDKMAHSSSSEELQLYTNGKRQGRETPNGKCSPSPPTLGAPDQLISSWAATTPPRGVSPENHCVTSPSCSCSRGRSPDRYYTSSSSSTCETPSPPRGLSPSHYWGMSRSPSASPRMTPRGQSPNHYYTTSSTSSSSSPCVTPPRDRSPDPSSIPSIQVHSKSSEEQEISTQSKECSQIPISIEACDKKHDIANAPRNINSSPVAQNKENKGFSTGRRNGLSPKKVPVCSCKHELDLKDRCPTDLNHCKEAAKRAKDARLVASSDKTTDSVITQIGNEIKEDENGHLNMNTNVTVSKCMYRPICRNHEVEHRCRDCCPQPDDLFFPLINRDRICLKEEICKELNRDGYKNLAIFSRVESEMKEYEASQNPAERVLDRLKASRPQLKLESFLEMLLIIDRRDIVDVIHNHHLSCNLCQKNSFDSKA